MLLPAGDAVRELNRPDQRRRPHRHSNKREDRKPNRRIGHAGGLERRPADSGALAACHGPQMRSRGRMASHAPCARNRHYVALHPLACRRRDGLRQKHLPNRDKIPLCGSPVSTGSAAVLGLAEVIFRSRYLGLKVIRLLAPKIASSLSLRTKPFSDFFARCGKESKRNFFWSPARVTTRDAAKEMQQ
jgi:hypothetical protein